MRNLIACTLIATLAACSTGTDYLANRGSDVLDIVRAKVMWGEGAGIKLDVTQYLHLGVMWEDHVDAAGFANRDAGTWREEVMSWGLLVGRWDETTDGVAKYAGSYGWNMDGGGFDFSDPHNKFVDSLMVRASVMVFGGIDLQVRVDEVIDLVAGLFMLDPSQDDE